MKIRSILSALTAFCAAVFLAVAPAAAIANPVIDGAISSGVVGEQADGYLGVVSGKSASADIQRTVDEINIKRKAVYTELAAQKGVSISQVAAVTAEKQIAKLSSGQYYQDASGAWKKK